MPAISVMIKPVSGACNMRCRYCFYTDVMNRREVHMHPRMTLETLETTVRRVMAYADDSVVFVLQGGEPTLIGLPFLEAMVRFQRMYNPRRIRIFCAAHRPKGNTLRQFPYQPFCTIPQAGQFGNIALFFQHWLGFPGCHPANPVLRVPVKNTDSLQRYHKIGIQTMLSAKRRTKSHNCVIGQL